MKYLKNTRKRYLFHNVFCSTRQKEGEKVAKGLSIPGILLSKDRKMCEIGGKEGKYCEKIYKIVRIIT